MPEIYWGLFITGLMLAFVTIVIGDALDGMLDGLLDFLSLEGPGILHPMTLVGGLTAFGGAGILLDKYTSWSQLLVFVFALLLTVLLSFLLHFLYVRPMRNAENSIGYSVQDLVGGIGEVTVTIPPDGYGEVVMKAGAGRVNKIASSFEGAEIASGQRVIVVEVKDGTLRVSPFDPDASHIDSPKEEKHV